MKTSDAIDYFGSVKETAIALGLTVQAVYAWGENVPDLRRYQIREMMEAREEQACEEKSSAKEAA